MFMRLIIGVYVFLLTDMASAREPAHLRSTYRSIERNTKDIQNVVCVRVKTTPDFWVKKMSTGWDVKNRTSPDFLYKYVVEIRFTENGKPRAYTVNVPLEGGVGEKTCFPKGSTKTLYKSNSSVMTNLSATVRAIPMDPINFERIVDYDGMYRPAKDLKMKVKQIISKNEQSFECTPLINGPFKLDSHLIDDIVITIGNGDQNITWQTQGETTREGKALEHFMNNFYPSSGYNIPVTDELIQQSNPVSSNNTRSEGTIFDFKYEGAIESIYISTPLVPLSCGVELFVPSSDITE